MSFSDAARFVPARDLPKRSAATRPERASSPARKARTGLRAIIAKLQNWIDVTKDDADALRRLQTSRGAGLDRVAGRLNTELSALSSGVAYRYQLSPDGQRTISALYYPGDFINYDLVEFGEANCELAAKRATFVTFDGTLKRLIKATPALETVITRAEFARSCFLTDRFCAAMRARGETRVLRTLLEMKACEELADGAPDDVVTVPFTQQELGDMTGLTCVYVSKVLSRLERQNHIERHGRQIRFRDRAYAEQLCGFTNYYARLKAPAPRPAPVAVGARAADLRLLA